MTPDMTTPETTTPDTTTQATTPPTTRPPLREEWLDGLDADAAAQVRADYEQECTRLEARGPVTLRLGEGTKGYFLWGGMAATDDGGHTLDGTHEIDTYTALTFAQVIHPGADFFRTVPVEVFDALEVFGTDDEAFRALTARPRLESLEVHAVVTEHAAQVLAEEMATDPDSEEEGNEHLQELVPTAGGRPLGGPALLTLTAHPELRDLRVWDTVADDAQIRELADALPDLSALCLTSSVATFADLSFLTGREGLQVLGLGGPAMRGASLATLPHLPGVAALSVTGEGIAAAIDASALRAALPALEVLSIRDGEGRPAHVRETIRLRHALPDLEINGQHYLPRALAKLATKFGIDLPAA